MKIAVLYICTGKYNQFFSGFYESSEKYFMNGLADLEYFVFTDDMTLNLSEKVHLYKRECKGFPLDSLFRFDMFLSIREELSHFDYVFFFNANMQFVAPVEREFLPEKENIMAVISPGYYDKPAFLYPYERNKKSAAYILPFKGPYHYYMGSLNGGKTADYIRLIESCSQNIHADYDSGYVAIYHDESHLNRYMFEHACLGLSPAYAYPEDSNIPYIPKIILRNKVKIDKYFDKGRDHSLTGRMKKAFVTLYRIINWYI